MEEVAMPRLEDSEVLSLAVAAAEAMTDEDLHAIFCEMVVTLDGELGDAYLPEDFPREPWGMSREEILAAVRRHQYWFDPYGGYPREPAG
jgi:hypothetical protein